MFCKKAKRNEKQRPHPNTIKPSPRHAAHKTCRTVPKTRPTLNKSSADKRNLDLLFGDATQSKLYAVPGSILRHHNFADSLPDRLYWRLRGLLAHVDLDKLNFDAPPSDDAVPATSPYVTDDQLPPAISEAEQRAVDAAAATHQSLNASEISFVLNHPDNTRPWHLHVQPPPEPRTTDASVMHHWMSRRLAAKRKERIVWPSKLDALFETEHDGMGMAKQTQLRVDWATKDFAEYLQQFNVGGTDEAAPDDAAAGGRAGGHPPPAAERPTMSSEIIREMFSIMGSNQAGAALEVQSEVVRAIPEDVARSLQMPSISIDHQVGHMLRFNEQQRRGRRCRPKHAHPHRHAFGRSIPLDRFDADVAAQAQDVPPLTSEFPDDLRSVRAVFEGIEHLGSVRKLVEYLREHPEKPRPPYLKQRFSFEAGGRGGDGQSVTSCREEAAAAGTAGRGCHVPIYKLFVAQDFK